MNVELKNQYFILMTFPFYQLLYKRSSLLLNNIPLSLLNRKWKMFSSKLAAFLVFPSLLVVFVECFVQYQPTWLTSNYIRAGNQNLFITLTGSGVLNTYIFTFSSSLSGIPLLGYGIKSYQGSDYFGQQRFEVNRTALTASTFTVNMQLIGATNLYILNVPYIAIDPLFPHHINSFDNVPVNYSAGDLVNVSVKDYVNPVYYTNVINYTSQTLGQTYRYFSSPLQNNKILLFMTTMYITGINQAATAPASSFNPLHLHVHTGILTNETYLINVTLSIKINLERLQFSMIIFDQADVQSSYKYFLEYQTVNFTDQGGFVPVPAEFIDNFIMGFAQFSSYRTLTAIHFSWDFTTVNGTHGALMPKSIGLSPTGFVITRICFSIFYMKSWLCPNETYLNLTNNLCETCLIEGCVQCLSLKACAVCDNNHQYKLIGTKCVRCDVDNNYYLNKTTMQCQQCDSWACPLPIIEKYSCNSLVITIAITEVLPVNCSMDQVSITNDGIVVTSAQILQHKSINEGPAIVIIAKYDRDIDINEKIVVYLGPNDKRIINCNPSVPPMLYSENQCAIEKSVQQLTKFIQGASYFLLIMSLLSCKIVGLELFGVLQLAYFSLGSYSHLDIYLAPLVQLKSANGFNFNNLLSSIPASKILTYMNIKTSFLNNINVMILLLFGLMIIGGIILLVSKFVFNRTLQNKIRMVIKQGSITLCMFNILSVGYSLGVHLSYSQQQSSALQTQYIISTVFMCLTMLLCLVVIVIIQFTDASDYGEFKNKFKFTWVCMAYIVISVIYRTAVAIYISTHTYYQQATLLILSISLLYLMYFIVNLPFVDWYQNYRAGLCHVTQLIILLSANYYRSMKSNTPLSIKSRLHTFPIIILILIVLCIVVSAIVLFAQVGQALRQYCYKRKQAMRIDDDVKRQSELSIADLQG